MNDMLAWLLAGHMAGDFLFQTRWMAERKVAYFPALATHAAIYTCAVWLFSLPAGGFGGGLSLPCLIFVFFSHAVIDRRGITKWCCRHVTKCDKAWLVMTTDQSLHVVILAAACLLERSISGGWF